MSQGSVLKVRVSLKGRPIRSYTFAQRAISVGRDPESDIFLDNAGVSRNHAKFELTPGGFVVEDLGSANGTFLNDEQIAKKSVADDDIVRVGKFALWINMGEDQRTKAGSSKRVSTTQDQGTVVLSNDQIDRMLTTIKADEEDAMLEPAPSSRGGRESHVSPRAAKAPVILAASASFLVGVACGAMLAWLIFTQNPTFLSAVQ